MLFTQKLRFTAVLAATVVVFGVPSIALAGLPPTGVSLKKHLETLPLEPTKLGDFVKDKAAAIRLGKALFWDMSVGSDGVTACASCHFSGGADNRAKNQLSPGINRSLQSGRSSPDITFFDEGANYTLEADDFPLHHLSNPLDRKSAVLRSSNDIVSSQGVVSRTFLNAIPGFPVELTSFLRDTEGFTVNGTNVRRVEPRNTPSVINAVLNFRNFWDGRAQNDFNGVSPFGARDPNAFLYKKDANGKLVKTTVTINNSSLASQAVGPPQSSFEMSAVGRPFAKIGVKMLAIRPLGRQLVAADDSVLGTLSRSPNKGLKTSNYNDMVKAAFKSDWYGASQYLRVVGTSVEPLSTAAGIASKLRGEQTYTQAEFNFSLFFGLAIQMYEATLISDQTPFDDYLDGNANALTAQQKYGFELFGNNTKVDGIVPGPARCSNCHGGPETTDASVFKVSKAINTLEFGTGVGPLRRRSNNAIGVSNILDLGFNNIGVTPVLEDLGVGGNDPFDKPLSVARQAFLDGNSFINQTTDTLGADGAFKIPMLRNVELTAPYFHNGDSKTLSEVVDFYFRGGNHQSAPVRPPLKTGVLAGFNATRLAPVGIAPLGTLSGSDFDNQGPQAPCNPQVIPGCEFKGGEMVENDKKALVAFLLSMTDERVKFRKAPFDHPQLFVPNGHVGDEDFVLNLGGSAIDQFIEIPAVGKNGGPQLPKFLGLSQKP